MSRSRRPSSVGSEGCVATTGAYSGLRRATIAVTASAQAPTEWPATTRRRSSAPVSARTVGISRREGDEPLSQRLGIPRREGEFERQAVQELLQRRVAGEHRHLASGCLVDDLVERLAPARLRRAQEAVGARQQRGELVARQRRLDPDALAQLGRSTHGLLQLAAMRALVVGQLRPSDLEPDVAAALDGEGERLQHRVVALPARRPAEGEQARRTVVAVPRGRGELRHVDRVPGRLELRRRDREGAAADADNDVDERQRQAQRPARVPVRVPEQDRDAQRLHERRRKQREQRHHVDEHGRGPRRARQHRGSERAHESDAAPDPGAGAEGAQAHVGGQVVPSTASQRTSTASHRAASSRRTSTVWASTGWSASTFWVTKRIRTAQRAVPAIVASTSARISRASSSGVACQSA